MCCVVLPETNFTFYHFAFQLNLQLSKLDLQSIWHYRSYTLSNLIGILSKYNDILRSQEAKMGLLLEHSLGGLVPSALEIHLSH